MSSLLIVGGGIAGIVAALAGRARGDEVTLMEKAPAIGGLLRSYQPPGTSESFDCGTHIPAETGDPELDRLLFGWMTPQDWEVLPSLRGGTFWNAQLSSASPCLDLRTLPPAVYAQVVAELLKSSEYPESEDATAANQLAHRYGKSFVRHVFDPIFKKFYGTEGHALAKDAHLLFGLARFICLDPDRTRQLKRDPHLDQKIAYHSHAESASTVGRARSFYPSSGGVGGWVAGLEATLRKSGVEILTNSMLSVLDPEAGLGLLTNGRRLRFDRVAWGLPGAALLRCCEHRATDAFAPVSTAAITLHHFIMDRPVATPAHYVTCYDSNFRTFRATCYSNLQPKTTGQHRVTAEVLSPPGSSSPTTAEEIFAELKTMMILDEKAVLRSAYTQHIPNGFPIRTVESQHDSVVAAEIIAAEFANVLLVGRAAGRSFFMRDVLLEAWRAVMDTPQGSDICLSRGRVRL